MLARGSWIKQCHVVAQPTSDADNAIDNGIDPSSTEKGVRRFAVWTRAGGIGLDPQHAQDSEAGRSQQVHQGARSSCLARPLGWIAHGGARSPFWTALSLAQTL